MLGGLILKRGAEFSIKLPVWQWAWDGPGSVFRNRPDEFCWHIAVLRMNPIEWKMEVFFLPEDAIRWWGSHK